MKPEIQGANVICRELCGGTASAVFPDQALHAETEKWTSTAYTRPSPEFETVTGTDRHSVLLLNDTTEIVPYANVADAVPTGALGAVV